MAVAIKICYPHHVPVDRKSWPEAAANVNVVVQIPYRCLMIRRIEQHIVRIAITVKVACSHQFPATGKRWPIRACDARWSRQIPNRSEEHTSELQSPY